MFEAVLAVHVLIAIALVVLVLLNQGKGADMGAAFGSGASSTVFGSRGAATFMTKLIATLGTAFFVTSLTLAVMASKGLGMGGGSTSVVDQAPSDERPAPEYEAPDAPDAPDVSGQAPSERGGDDAPVPPAAAPQPDGRRDVPSAPDAPQADEPAAELPSESPEAGQTSDSDAGAGETREER